MGEIGVARAATPSGGELLSRQLEAIGNNRSREMISYDKIRLIPPPRDSLPNFSRYIFFNK